MRALRFVPLILIGLGCVGAASAQSIVFDRDPPPRSSVASPSAYLEFRGAAPVDQAAPRPSAERARTPRFEMTIATPGSSFGHMRAGGSNARLECLVTSNLRRE